jgi:surfactin synthase thioesterase subunit
MACVALLWCNCAQAADTHAYLLRGWFGVFSTGMDELAAELQAQGIKANAIGHLSWKSTISKIVQDRASGKLGALVLVGHSQGAINAIEIARALEPHKIQVDLLVTLVPSMQNPVPVNVVRALNFYQYPGWGTPLSTDRDFRGKLSNIDLASYLTVTHITIDKDARVQAEIVRAALAIPKSSGGSQPNRSSQKRNAAGSRR